MQAITDFFVNQADLYKEMSMCCIRLAFLISLLLVSNAAYSAFATGVIDGVIDGTTVSGWACVRGSTRSIPVHIYVKPPSGYVMLDSVMASTSNETAVDNACLHAGTRARHRFNYRFTTEQKRNYAGMPIYIFGIADQTPHRALSHSGRHAVPVGKGYIDVQGGVSGSLKGWACVEKAPRSVYVDIFAGNRRIRSVLANQPGATTGDSNAIAAACKHTGQRGNHRFSLTFTDREKALYAGQSLSAQVRETQTWLANSRRSRMGGDVSHLFTDNTYSNSEQDRVSMTWDYSNTAQCSSIEGTLISFPGGAGTTHVDSDTYLQSVEKVLGQGCVRVIRADVNPGSSQRIGGYWLRNTSYREASGLMVRIIKSAAEKWRDHKGQRPVQGTIIVAGSSAGGMIAASALEWNVDYRRSVDRTIFVSAPLGTNLSVECARMNNSGITGWLDDIFKTGTTCERCSLNSACRVPADKDVVYRSDSYTRAYLNSVFYPENHMAILIGTRDGIGCPGGSAANCTHWTAEEAARRYIRSITGGNTSLFQEQIIPEGRQNRFSISLISGGTHDLWRHRLTRLNVCKNALAEVGKSYRICDEQL
jgi:hypothetical protein